MPEICYVPRKFSLESRQTIARAREICEEYAAQGFDLTLRQLYYQFVSRDWIANKDTEYKRLGSIINDARLAGLLDWKFIVDRTRNLRSNTHWETPEQIVEAAARSFMHDKWADQDYHTEVWIEKDALVGVLESCCPGEDVGFFSCRGYTSQSELWGAAQRLGAHLRVGKQVRIIHLGDHDPSGVDMTRDITERLRTFLITDGARERIGRLSSQEELTGELREQYEEELEQEVYGSFQVERIALTMDQIDEYEPPPNPAKLTDARAAGYVREHGYESWELDALEPTVLVGLIRSAIDRHRDVDRWEAAVEREENERKILTAASERWSDVREFLESGS